MTPPCLLPEIWKYIIYQKLDISSLVNLRSTAKEFRNCLELKKLLREKTIRWINQTRSLIDKAFISIDPTICDENLANLYYWTRRIKTTYDFNNEMRINRIIKELNHLISEECPEITNVDLVHGIHIFSVDIRPPASSPYAPGEPVKILIELPVAYPFESPTFTMLSDIFHPNYRMNKNIELYESSVNCAILPIYKLVLEILISLDYPEGMARSINENPILNETAQTLFLDDPADFFAYVALLSLVNNDKNKEYNTKM